MNSSALGNKFSRNWKIALSGLLLLHCLAVIAEPFRFFTRSSRGNSPAADPLRLTLAPYIEFVYLNHGYFFFAPEPGPSHLMECELRFGENELGRLRFPDKQAQRPRLLYHRHFMLAEFLHQLHVPPVQSAIIEGDDQLLADWRADRGRFELVRDSMIRHVISRYDADGATISRVEHRLPSSDEVLVQRIALNDPTLYVVLPDAPLFLPELPFAPGAEPSAAPVAEPSKPVAEPSKPVAEPSKPVAEPSKPVVEPSEPLVEAPAEEVVP
jgi:hypothetical protein